MNSRTFVGVVVCSAALLNGQANAGNIYDLGDFAFAGSGFTEVRATLETTFTGILTTESDIENFFNTAIYSVTVNDGAIRQFRMHNGNSSWNVRFEAFGGGSGGVSAILTVSPALMTLDFSTPNEITEGTLDLTNGDPVTGFNAWQYTQQNNVTDVTFAAFNDTNDSLAYVEIPYDVAFVFPRIVGAVPEPSILLLLGTVLIGVLRSTGRRRQ